MRRLTHVMFLSVLLFPACSDDAPRSIQSSSDSGLTSSSSDMNIVRDMKYVPDVGEMEDLNQVDVGDQQDMRNAREDSGRLDMSDRGDMSLAVDMSQGQDMSSAADMLSMIDSGEGMVDMPKAPLSLCEPSLSLAWRSGPALQGVARDHHVTFVHVNAAGDASLHVLGGTTYSAILQDHWRSPISATGDLGVWAQAAPIPRPRGGAAYTYVKGRHYLLGGREGQIINSVYASTLDLSGNITGWEVLQSIPAARFHGSATASTTHIYFGGGVNPMGNAMDDLYVGSLDAQGKVTGWASAKMPQPRSHHSSVVHQGYLYLIHGFFGNPFRNQTTSHNNIMRAKLDPSSGLPGSWESFLAEDAHVSTQSTTLDGDCACRFGGIVESPKGNYSYNSGVMCYDLSAKVSVKLPKGGASFNVGRSHMHQTPKHNGHYYIVGGSKAFRDVQNSVEIGQEVTLP